MVLSRAGAKLGYGDLRGRAGVRLLAIGLAALAVAGAARADPPRVSQPDWLARPDAEDLADTYPDLARALGIEGRATISCSVDLKGRLQDCVSPAASPQGLGFDQAALTMSKLFAMRPKRVDGVPVAGGTVRIPIRFTLPKADAPPPDGPLTPASDAARQAAQLSGMARGLASGLVEDVARIETDGTEATIAAQAVTALREARRRAAPEVAEAVARAIAGQLSSAEIDRWVAYLNGPAMRKLQAEGPRLSREITAAQAAHTGWVLSRARATFCGRQDCSSEATLLDLRALAEAPESPIDKPRWAQEPSLIEGQAAYPLAAQAFRVSGWAMLQCRVTEVGGLEDCAVLAQEPRRLGFGAAGLRVAGSYRLHPDLMAQGAAGDRVNLPTYFSIEPGAATAPPRARPSRALNLAREIVRAQGVEATAERAADLGQWLLSHQPGLDEAVRRDAGEAYRGAVIEDLPALLDAHAAAYAQVLTEPELADLAAFLHSRTGRLAAGRDEAFNLRLAEALGTVQARADAQARAAFCAAHACAAD